MNATQRKQLADQLRRAIVASGKSQIEIAKQLGVTKSAISRFVNGHRGISLENAEELARLLGLEITATKKRGKL